MGAPFKSPAVAPPRRYELLAHIMERIGHDGVAPTEEEMAQAMGISRARIRALIDQLVTEKHVERRKAGAARRLIVRDRANTRSLLVQVLRGMGGTTAEPMGELIQPCPYGHLPLLPPFEHLPDPD